MMRSRRIAAASVRQHVYREIVAPSASVSKQIVAGQAGKGALTMHEREERERQKPCQIFRGTGVTCERHLCGHPRAAHATPWRQAA